MNAKLDQIEKIVYDKCSFHISNLEIEAESQDYHACQFHLNGWLVICRNAKITPKKVGQFVTFWKRNESGTIEPFYETDQIDFFVINVGMDGRIGQFVFPKSILIDKGIISTKKKEGKRGFRVYSPWDIVTSPQAKRTQKWQVDYFYEINESINLEKVIDLYKKPNSNSF